jgi:hypothetical protein
MGALFIVGKILSWLAAYGLLHMVEPGRPTKRMIRAAVLILVLMVATHMADEGTRENSASAVSLCPAS